ncbi:cation efflux protein [Rickenella mellea]|uniref:Cation efflux protein n=1 Tax=Rickenella mellea TaxID=50990 RepID=A0A4Y7Q4Z0_9AGAM|nr:cation efflux protein [Rickenella mellea]
MKVTTRLGLVLVISVAFFTVEIAVGFRTKSLALIADAFHYLNDIVAYLIAFAASYLKNSRHRPPGFTFAFHRAELIGAFFNGVFLLALALSIFLQSVERFITIEPVKNPLSVIIVGGVGLCLNLLSAFIVHDHHGHGASNPTTAESSADRPSDPPNDITTDEQSAAIEEGDIHALHHHVRLPPPVNPHGNLGLMGVLIHILGDAANNVGVIIAGTIILELRSPHRFYVDPAVSLFISIMIFASAIPLTKNSGRTLLEAAPLHLDLEKVRADLLALPGVQSIHDFHIWHLSQNDLLSSFHVQVASPTTNLLQWEKIEESLRECMAAYGVTHVTIAPEIFASSGDGSTGRCKDLVCDVDVVRLRSGHGGTLD